MKKTVFVLAAFALLAASCTKEEAGKVNEPKEIVLSVGDDNIDMTVQTKATAVTAVPSSLYYGVTTGTAGTNDVAKKANTSGTVASNKIYTGLYLAASPVAMNYYVSNATMTAASTGWTIAATNTTDIVAGVTKANKTAAPSVTLNHIFARTGTLTCSAQSGYEISNVSWKIVSKSGGTGGTAGTYNISSGAWSGVTALTEAAITSSSDMYLTPGVYTFKVTYTLTKGDYQTTLTRSGDVTLVAGKVNNISCTAVGASASEIVIGVSLTAWSSQALTLTLS